MRCALQWRASVNTAGYTMLSGGRSLCCILSSDTVACYKADAVRYTLDVSGICWADLQGDRMGRVKDTHPCLNVSAFFGGGSHRLWHGKPEEIRAKKTAPPSLLCASSQGCGVVLNELLSSSGAAWWEIAWFLLPPVGARTDSHSPQMRSSPSFWVITDKLN